MDFKLCIKNVVNWLEQSFSSNDPKPYEEVLMSYRTNQEFQQILLNIIFDDKISEPIRRAALIQLKFICMEQYGFIFVLQSFENLNKIEDIRVHLIIEIIGIALANTNIEAIVNYVNMLQKDSFQNLKIAFLLIWILSKKNDCFKEVQKMFLHLTTSCIGNVHQFIASGQTLDNSMKFYLNLFIFYLFRTARKLLDQESTYSEELLKMIFDISIYYLENNPNIEGFDIPHKILNTLILYSPLGNDVTIDVIRLTNSFDIYKSGNPSKRTTIDYIRLMKNALLANKYQERNDIINILPHVFTDNILPLFTIPSFNPMNVNTQAFLDMYHPPPSTCTPISAAEFLINSIEYTESNYIIYMIAFQLAREKLSLDSISSFEVYGVFNFLTYFIKNMKPNQDLLNEFLLNYIAQIIYDNCDIIKVIASLNLLGFLPKDTLSEFSKQFSLLDKLSQWISDGCELLSSFSLVVIGRLADNLDSSIFPQLFDIAFNINKNLKVDLISTALNSIIKASGESIKPYLVQSLSQMLALFDEFTMELSENSDNYILATNYIEPIADFLEISSDKITLINIIYEWMDNTIENKKIVSIFCDEFLAILKETSKYLSDYKMFNKIFSYVAKIIEIDEEGATDLNAISTIIVYYIYNLNPTLESTLELVSQVIKYQEQRQYEDIGSEFLEVIFYKWKGEENFQTLNDFAINLYKYIQENDEAFCNVPDIFSSMIVFNPNINQKIDLTQFLFESSSLNSLCGIANFLMIFGDNLLSSKSTLLNDLSERFKECYSKLKKKSNYKDDPIYSNSIFQNEINKSIYFMNNFIQKL